MCQTVLSLLSVTPFPKNNFASDFIYGLLRIGRGLSSAFYHDVCVVSSGFQLLNKILGRNTSSGSTVSEEVNSLAEACRQMSEEKTGALIVITHGFPLDDIINTGDSIDAAIHTRLITNLFFKNSPLHDGALIISGGRIVAARCTLPITERTNIPASYGMRHKAAIGITESTDADAVVVSEETGKVSFVKGGKVTPIQNINELKLLLSTSLSNE